MIEDADRVWSEAMPDAYERWMVPTVFRPFAVEMSGRVAARRPQRVLELAAGTGVLTRELRAIAPAADIVATDLNGSMVEYGRIHVPDVTWRQADALDLPFEAGQFDVVVCQFGAMFFPDKQAAYAESGRVLKPGGTLLFSTWGSVAQHYFGDAVVTALDRVFPDDPPTFLASVPHGYADPDVVVNDVAAAGFDPVSVATVMREGHAASATDVAVGFCTGTPLRTAIEARADLAATTSAVAEVVETLLGRGPLTGPMTAYVVEAAVAC